jgi:hypothetical protein
MGKKLRSGSGGMNIPDPISESLKTFLWVKILKFFDADVDPGSGNLVNPNPGGKNPGSATLLVSYDF